MNHVPVTAEDFRKLGTRVDSELLLGVLNRMVPLATRDAAHLAGHEFNADDRTALETCRTQLTNEVSTNRDLRETKKAQRYGEADHVNEGKILLRTAIDVLHNKISSLTPAAGETPEHFHARIDLLVGRLDALGGTIRMDAVKLHTRLTGLNVLLADPVFAPSAGAAAARAQMVSQLTDLLTRLPATSEGKKSAQAASVEHQAALDVIDGRAAFLLKKLVRAGRSYWNSQHDRVHSGEYFVGPLRHHKRAKADGPATPATPTGAAPAPTGAAGGAPPAAPHTPPAGGSAAAIATAVMAVMAVAIAVILGAG
jgi:hypothetical protein